LYVEGRIQTRSWDDRNTGEKRYRTEILVSDVSLIGGRGEGEPAKSYTRDEFSQQPEHGTEITDEDIPF
jgi:single-strand DNA-binding protein